MTSPTHKLNVVFHGMFAFVIWKDVIEILAPQEEDHVYKAGSWGRERRLREGGAYTLLGVQPGHSRPRIDASRNLVVNGFKRIARDPEILFFSLRLPFPESITGMRHAKPRPGRRLFGGAAAAHSLPDAVPLIQVFTYRVADLSQVKLDSGPALMLPPGDDDVASLHVWAESDCVFTAAEQDHPLRGFQQLTSLFPGLDLQLQYSTSAPMDPTVPVPGMKVWEQATFRERSPLKYGVPVAPADRGAEVSNCISLIVDNADFASTSPAPEQ